MEMNQFLQQELKEAKSKRYALVAFALEELISNIDETDTEKEIFRTIENSINERGQKVLKYMKRNKINKIENDIFIINLYNNYLCRFHFQKNRQIVYEYTEDSPLEPDWNRETEIEPKVIRKDKITFFGFF